MNSTAFLSRLRIAIIALLVLFTLSALPLYADTLHVTQAGVFDPTTPTSSFTSPGGSFTFSFDVDAAPAIANSASGYSSLPFNNFTYTLDGNGVALPANELDLFGDSYGGLYDLCLDSSCSLGNLFNNGFVFSGPQIYAGTESAPDILTGSFTPAFSGVVVDGNGYLLQSASDTVIASQAIADGQSAALTPEPSTLLLLGTGMIVVATRLRKKVS